MKLSETERVRMRARVKAGCRSPLLSGSWQTQQILPVLLPLLSKTWPHSENGALVNATCAHDWSMGVLSSSVLSEHPLLFTRPHTCLLSSHLTVLRILCKTYSSGVTIPGHLQFTFQFLSLAYEAIRSLTSDSFPLCSLSPYPTCLLSSPFTVSTVFDTHNTSSAEVRLLLTETWTQYTPTFQLTTIYLNHIIWEA